MILDFALVARRLQGRLGNELGFDISIGKGHVIRSSTLDGLKKRQV
jgi:hypothetical protein